VFCGEGANYTCQLIPDLESIPRNPDALANARVSVTRFRLLKIGTILRGDQRIHWNFFGFAAR